MQSFTHLDSSGQASMVDVSAKATTARRAVAIGSISMSPETVAAVRNQALHKGDVLAVARIAGIQAAKKCSDLIPLCHPLALSKISLEFSVHDHGVSVSCECKLKGQTGVEMEALTGVSVALLTIYDMCKALDTTMEIGEIALQSKSGGSSERNG